MQTTCYLITNKFNRLLQAMQTSLIRRSLDYPSLKYTTANVLMCVCGGGGGGRTGPFFASALSQGILKKNIN